MAKTIYTKDGKGHALLGSTTVSSIIQEYCGHDIINAIQMELFDVISSLETYANMFDGDDVEIVYDAISRIKSLFN